jgi:hypothetical protein
MMVGVPLSLLVGGVFLVNRGLRQNHLAQLANSRSLETLPGPAVPFRPATETPGGD